MQELDRAIQSLKKVTRFRMKWWDLCLVFTAKAAFIVRGGTLNSMFQIPSDSKLWSLTKLKSEKPAKMQNRFRNIKLVIIDQYSMLRDKMLGKTKQYECVKLEETQTTFLVGFQWYLLLFNLFKNNDKNNGAFSVAEALQIFKIWDSPSKRILSHYTIHTYSNITKH